MIRTFGIALGCLLVGSVVSACSAAETDEVESAEGAQVTGTKVESGKTKSFTGTFSITTAQGRRARIEMHVTQIDWEALTARWESKIIDAGGDRTLTGERGVFTKIRLARCPGCYTFDVVQGAESISDNESTIARVQFSNTQLASVSYLDKEGLDERITATTTASDSGSGSGGGASCALTCGGQLLECSEGGTAATCKADRFRALPRCPYEVTFQARSCTAPAAPTGGSCKIVCAGSVTACKSVANEAACTSSAFDTLPRCFFSTQYEAGASCPSR